jgi:hypothetical protein
MNLRPAVVLISTLASLFVPAMALGDGKVFPPRSYVGSLEEKSQEAIIIFHSADIQGESTEDLILKIAVQGETDRFAWVVPFPSEPEVKAEKAALFAELFRYTESRLVSKRSIGSANMKDGPAKDVEAKPVTVLSRHIVGSYDVAIVRENVAGALNVWLKSEGFQDLGDAEDVLSFYRNKNYVFACIKFKDMVLRKDEPLDVHPLRFTFKPGGRDGIYFPMKLTGLQKDPFFVNLYVFHRWWINDDRSKYGYVHRGFHLRYRDWDGPKCEPNGGKAYSAPESDPFLRDGAHMLPETTRLFQKLHPGERYYLTNIQATLRPEDVRDWPDDLWLFPYYTNSQYVPHDARVGGPAAGAWPNDRVPDDYEPPAEEHPFRWTVPLIVGSMLLLTGIVGLAWWRKWV